MRLYVHDSQCLCLARPIMWWALQSWVDATDILCWNPSVNLESFCFHVLTYIYCWNLCWIFKLSYTIVTCCLWLLLFLPWMLPSLHALVHISDSAGLYLDEQISTCMKCPYKHKFHAYHRHNLQTLLNPNNHHYELKHPANETWSFNEKSVCCFKKGCVQGMPWSGHEWTAMWFTWGGGESKLQHVHTYLYTLATAWVGKNVCFLHNAFLSVFISEQS